ncbi:hypothetical protein [uncultured Shimia sp.]|uniref:hypothetical protein n=1 Tax=uncultured Shimia sp. TaxID=573152 RepID=UPI0025CD1974|nr:hypothetical protein [uncultured Shimia sp.]
MRSRILSTTVFQKLMGGHLSVADTFWFGFVGVSLTLNLLTLVLAGPVTALSLSFGAWAGKIFSVVWLFGCSAYTVLMFRALWRSMLRHGFVNGLSIAGLLLVVALLGRYGYGLVSVFDPSLPMARGAVLHEIDAMRLTLPRDVGPGATLVSVSLVGTTYEMTVQLQGPGLVATYVDLMDTEIGPEICATHEALLRSAAVDRMETHYISNDGEFRTVLKADDCLQYLDRR